MSAGSLRAREPGDSLGGAHTARLLLQQPTASDVPELFAMYDTPEVWRDDPALRHASATETQAWVERHIRRWQQHGLGIWVLRTAEGTSAGRLVGVGGCSLPNEAAWNLAFTLHPRAWGQGYAQEVAAAGIGCARQLRPNLPITTVVARSNERPQRAVTRAGLDEVWRGPDPEGSDPAAVVLLYADRVLAGDQIRALTAPPLVQPATSA